MRCEGYRRYGGVFTFGPVKWEQCKNEAIVNLTIKQDRKEQTLPACLVCWEECMSTGIKVTRSIPLTIAVIDKERKDATAKKKGKRG